MRAFPRDEGLNALLRAVLPPLALFGLVCAGAIPASAAGCPPGTVQIGEQTEETATATIIHPVCQREVRKATGADNATKFCTAKLRVDADKRALQQMNFTNDANSFEMFQAISEQQKAALKKKMVDALLDQALNATTVAADSAKSLNPYNVNTTIKQLRAKGWSNDVIFAALRKIAATKGKPAMAEAYGELVEAIKNAKGDYETGREMANDPQHDPLLFLSVLKFAQGNPQLGLAVTGADFLESAAYYGYVTVKVDDLNKITDDKLLLLNSRIGRLKQDVRALDAAKQVWAAGEKSDEPDCPN